MVVDGFRGMDDEIKVWSRYLPFVQVGEGLGACMCVRLRRVIEDVKEELSVGEGMCVELMLRSPYRMRFEMVVSCLSESQNVLLILIEWLESGA